MAKIQIAYGVVKKNGSKLIGDGFRSERIKTGKYKITFNSRFKKVPAVTATAEHDEDSPRQVINVVIDKQESNDERRKHVIVLVQTPNGEANNNRFQFTAIATE